MKWNCRWNVSEYEEVFWMNKILSSVSTTMLRVCAAHVLSAQTTENWRWTYRIRSRKWKIRPSHFESVDNSSYRSMAMRLSKFNESFAKRHWEWKHYTESETDNSKCYIKNERDIRDRKKNCSLLKICSCWRASK